MALVVSDLPGTGEAGRADGASGCCCRGGWLAGEGAAACLLGMARVGEQRGLENRVLQGGYQTLTSFSRCTWVGGSGGCCCNGV